MSEVGDLERRASCLPSAPSHQLRYPAFRRPKRRGGPVAERSSQLKIRISSAEECSLGWGGAQWRRGGKSPVFSPWSSSCTLQHHALPPPGDPLSSFEGEKRGPIPWGESRLGAADPGAPVPSPAPVLEVLDASGCCREPDWLLCCATLRRAFFGSGSPQDVLLSSEELPGYHVPPRSRPPAPPPSLPNLQSIPAHHTLDLTRVNLTTMPGTTPLGKQIPVPASFFPRHPPWGPR